MKRIFSRFLIYFLITFILISIYCLLIDTNKTFEIIVYVITSFLILIGVILSKSIVSILKENSFDKIISFVSLEIALIAFIQTGIEIRKNNEQFEANRLASEELFKKQQEHSEKLNTLIVANSKELNDNLIGEVKNLQTINETQSEAAEKQLEASKQQLLLARQSLDDYIYETKPELVIETTKISNIDTVDNNLQLSITSIIKNNGKRQAKKVEFRQAIVYNNILKNIGLNEDADFITSNKLIQLDHHSIIPQNFSNDFFYWIQIQYYDDKLDLHVDQSFYYHYYKSAKGFDFYYANKDDKSRLKKLIDQNLSQNNLSKTVN